METISKKDYQRLKALISLGANVVLKSKEHRKEYEDLHLLIEGFKPSCTGCSARGKLEQWKRKYQSVERTEIKLKTNTMTTKAKNTFKLKRSHPRVVVPFTSRVITDNSSDEIVHFYLDQADTEEERKRRESFFEKLPEPKEKEGADVDREGLIEEYTKLFGKAPSKNIKTKTLIKKIEKKKEEGLPKSKVEDLPEPKENEGTNGSETTKVD